MTVNLILFDLKNKIDCTKLKEDHDYGSHLILGRDQQTEFRPDLLRIKLNYNKGQFHDPSLFLSGQ